MPKIKEKEPTLLRSHYTVCTAENLIYNFGSEIYEAKIRGKFITCGSKIFSSQARLIRKIHTWNEKTARLYAIKCAKHVLKNWEDIWSDKRPRIAIQKAHLFLLGKITKSELEKSNRDAFDASQKHRERRINCWETLSSTFDSDAAYASYCSSQSFENRYEYIAEDTVDAAAKSAEQPKSDESNYGSNRKKARARERDWQMKTLLKMLNI